MNSIVDLINKEILNEEEKQQILNASDKQREEFALLSRDLELLTDLVFDRVDGVRLAILSNPAITFPIIDVLSKDENSIIAKEALRLKGETGDAIK